MRPILGKLRGWVLPVVLAAGSGAGGCGPGSGTISGKVVNGQGTALKGGTVVFYADKDHPFGPVQITKEGTYKIENVPAGDYIVTVETDSMKPPPPNAHVNAAPPDAKGACAGQYGKYRRTLRSHSRQLRRPDKKRPEVYREAGQE